MKYGYLPSEPNLVKNVIGEPTTKEEIDRRIQVKSMMIRCIKKEILDLRAQVHRHRLEIMRLNEKVLSEKDRSPGNP